jgi:hypothetical protein
MREFVVVANAAARFVIDPETKISQPRSLPCCRWSELFRIANQADIATPTGSVATLDHSAVVV